MPDYYVDDMWSERLPDGSNPNMPGYGGSPLINLARRLLKRRKTDQPTAPVMTRATDPPAVNPNLSTYSTPPPVDPRIMRAPDSSLAVDPTMGGSVRPRRATDFAVNPATAPAVSADNSYLAISPDALRRVMMPPAAGGSMAVDPAIARPLSVQHEFGHSLVISPDSLQRVATPAAGATAPTGPTTAPVSSVDDARLAVNPAADPVMAAYLRDEAARNAAPKHTGNRVLSTLRGAGVAAEGALEHGGSFFDATRAGIVGAGEGAIDKDFYGRVQKARKVAQADANLNQEIQRRGALVQIADTESQRRLREAQAAAAPAREAREALTERQRWVLDMWKTKGSYKRGVDPTYDAMADAVGLYLPEYEKGENPEHVEANGVVYERNRTTGVWEPAKGIPVDTTKTASGRGAAGYSLKGYEKKPGKSGATARALAGLDESQKPQGQVWDALIREGYQNSDATDEEGKQRDAQDYAMRQIVKKPALAGQVFKDPNTSVKIRQRIADEEGKDEAGVEEWNRTLARVENNVRTKGSFEGLYREMPDNLERKMQQYKKQRAKLKDSKARRQLDQQWNDYVSNIYLQ